MQNGSISNSTGLGAFAWASTVTPPPEGSGSRVDSELKTLYEEENGKELVDATGLGEAGQPVDGERRGGNQPWDVTVAVPPSKVMRDTVRFEGLSVLLFFVDEKEESTQTEVGELETVLLSERVLVIGIPAPPYVFRGLSLKRWAFEIITSMRATCVSHKSPLLVKSPLAKGTSTTTCEGSPANLEDLACCLLGSGQPIGLRQIFPFGLSRKNS